MRDNRHKAAELLGPLLLFLLFAAAALAVVSAGAGAYRSAAAGLQETFSVRTALSYVTQKVRHADQSGLVQLVSLEDCTALRLENSGQQAGYCTYLYYFDGALRELTCAETADAQLSAGQEIAQLDSASFQALGDGLYRFTVGLDGKTRQVLFCLHSQEVSP